MKTIRSMMLLLSLVSPGLSSSARAIEGIRLPEGFRIEVFAEGVKNARAMALGDDGTVYVGSSGAGKIYALPDRDGNGKADEVITIASDLEHPIGVAFRQGDLYVGAISRILKYPKIGSRLKSPPVPQVITDRLPSERHHGGRFIGFGPDGWLYVGLGAPCNVCEKKGPWFNALGRIRPDGTKLEIFAEGVRNTVGFDWHPLTRELWFTDNGRDWMGDDSPPDELNRAPRKGMNFGFPYCHGQGIRDPDHGKGKSCDAYVPSAQNLGPHVAALGMRFYTGQNFPKKYRNQIFIAEHGSWNRSRKIGYQVSWVRLEGNRPVSYEPFATGWLNGDKVRGRPVDLLNLKDGSLLVSDDFSDRIYRIRHEAPGPDRSPKD